ncbi:hypothetical protein F8O01_06180 [Pseudoclavibacter chungangensis]|uniref:Uncharacterized protein n=1 Tax=Pseudoclavibacter chungangensis TaxID=587635 RepID=A0A7J5BYT1_9MICO|nr:hypothetical protein [Pseudoclavibacter chungangensis]KAB1659509.1 hypothetical protein F8O01_06180 [Pseudoclavibacter chungangensis]NYJ67630.1 archaellum biogenesis protein FlaJ (TadC family) [Pseudoclavibacter chungangensis]
MNGPATTPTRPAPLRLLAGVLALEALAVLGAAVLLVVEVLVDVPNSLVASIALIALTVLAFALGVVLVIGVWQRRAWVRGATITWQVLQIGAAWVILQGDMAAWIGWVLVVLAVIAIVCVLHPATRGALRDRDGRELDAR